MEVGREEGRAEGLREKKRFRIFWALRKIILKVIKIDSNIWKIALYQLRN